MIETSTEKKETAVKLEAAVREEAISTGVAAPRRPSDGGGRFLSKNAGFLKGGVGGVLVLKLE